MKRELLELLVDPVTGGPLALEPASLAEDGSILEGTLRGTSGERYAITSS